MLVAAAVCPHPPLLIPEATGSPGRPYAVELAADGQIRALRAACRDAVAALDVARPDLIAVVGGAPETAAYPESACGGLHRLGIPFATGNGPPVLPLSLAVGAWLVRTRPALPSRPVAASISPVPHRPEGVGPAYQPRRSQPRVSLQAVGQALPAAACLRLGANLADLAPRVALLAMGDGTARRATGVPRGADPQAEAYDAQVAAALAAADTDALARLDPALDAELLVAGRAAWQVLAGAAQAGRWRGRVTFTAAPLGVGYLVAAWTR